MDNRTNFPSVSKGAAESIAGPTIGWADVSTSTSTEYIDLADWAGLYVTLEAETADHYFAFVKSSSVAMVMGAAATVGTAGVPRTVRTSAPEPVVVPKGHTVLAYRTVSGNGALRVTRS